MTSFSHRLLVVFLLLASVGSVPAQTVASADSETLWAGVPGGQSLLAAPARLQVENVLLVAALQALSERSGVPLAYSPSLLPPKLASCVCAERTVGEALAQLLAGTPFEYSVVGEQVLIERPRREPYSGREIQLAGRFVPLSRPPVFGEFALGQGLRQRGSISGRVSDGATGEPLAGVLVTVLGTQIGQLSDEAGVYTIRDVPAGQQRLRAARIGYAPQEIAVTVLEDRIATADFVLLPVAIPLQGIVGTVVGERRRVETPNAITTIDVQTLVQTAPVRTVADLISGRAPGAQILSGSGTTGTGSRIRIRGQNSFSLANDPIIYIDGVRAESRSVALPQVGGVSTTIAIPPSRLDDIAPDEIESIDVIRGPAAATLYGTDAANGVILIHTRRGRVGAPRWDFYVEQGLIRQPNRFPDAYHSWGRLPSGAVTHCILPSMAAGGCVQDSLSVYSVFNDADATPFGSGYRQQYGLQVSGGSEQVRYFLSGDLENEIGPMRMPAEEVTRLEAERGARVPFGQRRPNAVDRLRFRGNLVGSLSPNADITVTTSYNTGETRLPIADGAAILGLMMNGLGGPGYRSPNEGWWMFRPGEIFAIETTQDVNRFTGGIESSYRPLEWLSMRARVGLDHTNRRDEHIQRRGQGIDFADYRQGRRIDSRAAIAHHTVDLGASGRFALTPQVSSITSVGAQYHRQSLSQLNAGASQLPPGSVNVGGGAVRNVSESASEAVTLGAYIQQELGINERVFVTAGVRSDNNSAFGRELEAVYYPQIGVSWMISEEPFLPRSELLSSLRLRAAYGASGVSPGALDALLRYSAFSAVESGTEVPGLQFQALGNPALRPERTTEFETGVDAGFLGGRIGLELTYYDKHSRDALVARPLPFSLGVVSASRFENLGSVRNRGFEALLSAQILAGAELSWDVQVSGSRNSNELVELGAGITPIIASFGIRTVPGFPLFGFWDRPILSFEDANDNGIIEAGEIVMGDTAVYIGSSIPTREASLNSTLRLLRDRIRIGTQLDYRGGFVQLNVTEWFRCTSTNNCRAANDPSAPLDEQAAAVAARTPALGSSMEGYMEDGSFLRFREASLTVAFPGGLSRALRTSNASVTLSGRNLGIITGYRGPDPEVTHAQAFESQPFDMFMVPQNRYWLIRMNLGF